MSKKFVTMRQDVITRYMNGQSPKTIIRCTNFKKSFVYSVLRKAGISLRPDTGDQDTVRCPKCGSRLLQDPCIACQLKAAPIESPPEKMPDPRRLTRSELDSLLSTLLKAGSIDLAKAIKANYEKSPPVND